MIFQFLLRRISLLPIVGLLPALLLTPDRANSAEWGLCRTPDFEYLKPDDLSEGQSKLEAQTLISNNGDQVLLKGGVMVLRTQQSIRADEVNLDKITDQIKAVGNVRFESADYRLSSELASVDNRNNTALFENADFTLPSRHLSGQASRIEKLDESRSRFSGLTYSSCDPQNLDWYLQASELEIDDESGRGSAKHTTLYFKDFPIFYLPYFLFPVDDRRMSGILSPGLGYSDSLGVNFTLPVYWNIAPNYDATITPASYEKRGLQLTTENRYLFDRNNGQVDLSYLDDKETKTGRWFQQWQHRSRFGLTSSIDLLVAEVSDNDFFDEFSGIAPQYNDTSHLERHVTVNSSFGNWSGKIHWQNYQTLDTSTLVEDRPYQSLPAISLQRQTLPLYDSLTFDFRAEWVDFERVDSVVGKRSHLVPQLSWQSRDSWYFIKPALQLSLTDYQLEDNIGDDSITRSIPTFSLDNGLIFDRTIGEDKGWIQTLEPRLYFLHTPFEEQDQIPDFDTSVLSSSYNNLFKNNRFNGSDRIGDANQVTLGISSRLFRSEDGGQLMHAKLGQIHYAEDRRVSLDGAVDTEPRSDMIAELDLWPNVNTKITSSIVYSAANNQVQQRDISINYARRGFATNFAYYFTDAELEQALVSMVYPINERWSMVAKYHQSLLFDKPVENLFGLSYESCCWGLKILASQTGDEAQDFAETENAVFFELTLKGLSQAGEDIDTRIANSIPGYSSNF
ncbi:MAG: LPS-assembly protein [Planctomycetota bacterium]